MPDAPAGFLLDENLSWRVASALQLATYPATHVALEPDLGKGVADEEIPPWCGRAGYAWVTVDHDPRSRHIRFAMLPSLGIHAIILDPEPKGVREQLWRIVTRFEEWERMLPTTQAGPGRAWRQRRQGQLEPLKGK